MIINVGESSAKATSYDNSESGLEATNVQEAIDGLKKSVSNGKSTVASAITTKGVTTASDATFDTMATNIKNIPNANSATYTPTWNGTHDMGYNNTYRYVNTNTIYNSGYNSGKAVYCGTANGTTYTKGTSGSAPGYFTFNVASTLSNYKNVSANNFKLMITGGAFSNYDGGIGPWAVLNATLSAQIQFYEGVISAYNANTGDITMKMPYIQFNTWNANTGASYGTSYRELKCAIYCIHT